MLGVTKSEGKHVLLLQRTENGESSVIASIEINPRYELKLQVKADGDKYWFNFSENDGEFINLGGVVSGDILSTNVAGASREALSAFMPRRQMIHHRDNLLLTTKNRNVESHH